MSGPPSAIAKEEEKELAKKNGAPDIRDVWVKQRVVGGGRGARAHSVPSLSGLFQLLRGSV